MFFGKLYLKKRNNIFEARWAFDRIILVIKNRYFLSDRLLGGSFDREV